MSYSTINLIIIVFLLIISGIFSASETALLSFKNMDFENLKRDNPKLHATLRKWLENPSSILSTVLISNNAINIFLSALATDIMSRYYDRGPTLIFTTLVVTVSILIFGEITPKLIAKNYASSISKKVIIPLTMFSSILYPIIFLLTSISKIVARIIGLNIEDREITVTEKDIRSLIFFGSEEGVIDREKRDMLDAIFKFNDLTADDLVTPRHNVFMLKSSDKIGEVIASIMDKGFSRIPVYEENIDNIIGAVYVKDLMPYLKNGLLNLTLKEIMRDTHFVPETKSAFSLLKEFREQKIHMAVVVDEYGGTVGIITIEDILEEIVGEIRDEFDKDVVDIRKLDKDKYIIKGDLDIDEINKETKFNIPESDEYDSLGGFIASITGRMPKKGEVINWKNFNIVVREVGKHAVKYAMIEKLDISLKDELTKEKE